MKEIQDSLANAGLLIRKINLFSHLEGAELDSFAAAFVRREVRAGEEIFDQDDPSDELFLIIKGRVRIVRKGEDGREVTLAGLTEGGFFGEISIFTGEPRSAAAVAAEPSSLLVLAREPFLSVLAASPDISRKILVEMSRRLLEADRTIASLLWDNAYQKVLFTLKRLIQTEGVPRGDAVVIKRKVTHQEIADMAGTSRETASRILVYLKKHGAVVPSGKNVIVREWAVPAVFEHQ
jgi:CRP/FNR family cyclic AMP-dependent transcriptional regulator